MYAFDYLLLISDHGKNFEFLQSGPAVIDYVEHPNPQIPIPNVIDICFPDASLRTYSMKTQSQIPMCPPTFLTSSFIIKETTFYAMILRYDLPIPSYQKGNLLWNEVIRRKKVPLGTNHARYALCLITCYPIVTSAKALLSYLYAAYIDVPPIPIDPYNVNTIQTTPFYFPNLYVC